MKIIIYNETILSGGIEKCIENIIMYFSKEHEFEIVYIDEKKTDPKIVNILQQYAKVHKLKQNEIIEADICIWCRLYMDYKKIKPHIKAKKQYLWVHSKPRELENCLLDNKEFMSEINEIICVSNVVKKMLDVDKKSIVIHNFLPNNIKQLALQEYTENVFKEKEKLKLVTVSRLSNGKGFDRVKKLAQMLKDNKIDFEYVVVGKGRAKEEEIKQDLSNYKEIKFIGYKENPYPYIKNADYLVQLSDFETWGNVILEAKSLGIPVIITSFETAYEQIEDDINGIIIRLEDTNYNNYLKRIIENKQKYKDNLKNFKYHNEIKKWEKIFDKE